MKRAVLLFAVFLFLGIPAVLAEDKEGVEVTVYNQNFGLVKDRRLISLKEGASDIRFSDVASQIEPTSVRFKSLTSPLGCIIQEQNYEYDLVSADKLLGKYIDKKIKMITMDDKVYEGILMSYDAENIVISQSDILSLVCRRENIRDISFPELPEGLITKPTLMWQIANDKAGGHLCEVSYLTGGITWGADYVVVVDKADKNIECHINCNCRDSGKNTSDILRQPINGETEILAQIQRESRKVRGYFFFQKFYFIGNTLGSATAQMGRENNRFMKNSGADEKKRDYYDDDKQNNRDKGG